MNKFEGIVKKIKTTGQLSQVSVAIDSEIVLHSIVIETPESSSFLQKDHKVKVVFKETEIIIEKGVGAKLSLINRIRGSVVDIAAGELLCEVSIQTSAGIIHAIVSRDALEHLTLNKGDTVTAMVKLNEVMIAE